MRVLLTGVTGFLGSAVGGALLNHEDYDVTLVARTVNNIFPEALIVEDIGIETDWSEALDDVEVIVHTAARNHIMKDNVVDSLSEYRAVNVEGTLELARQAALLGVSRFVFISSVKVNGEKSMLGKAFTENDLSVPEDPYGISKFEAEQGLNEIAGETDMEVVIIRPPLVYGPNAPGNFGNLMRWVEKGIPLPLGAIYNQRSLVAVDNLVDLILTCIDHPAAANEVFLAADGHDLSTSELLRGVAKAMGRPSRLIPLPASFLMMGASLLGKKSMAQRLLGSLQVDISKARNLLGWEPPISVEEGLKRCFK